MSKHRAHTSLLFLATACATLALAACGKSPEPDAAAPVAAAMPADEAAANAAAQADADRSAEMAAKERALSEREAAVKVQELEAELARRDAETAATFAAEQNAKASAATAAAKKAQAKAATAAATPKTPIPAAPIIVPAGTSLVVALNSDVNTKTASVGDPVHGRLNSDVMIGDRRAASTGAPISGTVTQVISGSDKIGGTPTLGIEFTSLVAVDGTTVPIGAQLVQVGKSETAKDTAKILGGAAAGAIIGHQVNSKNGSVVGGILGGAAGTAAAKNTGKEVLLPAGTVVSVATTSSFQVDR